MIPELDPVEIRVLGCLLEKEVLTPDVYPMTVNGLITACNQTTNRWPVVRYGEAEVTAALTSMRERGLTRIVYSTSNRAPKHRQVAVEALRLEAPERAVLCVLLLRGPQTPGELKARTERLHPFEGLAEVQAAIDGLAGLAGLEGLAGRDEPLVVRLPRRPGQKEERFAHLLGGAVADAPEMADEPAVVRRSGLEARVDVLEAEVASLRAVVEELRALLD